MPSRSTSSAVGPSFLRTDRFLLDFHRRVVVQLVTEFISREYLNMKSRSRGYRIAKLIAVIAVSFVAVLGLMKTSPDRPKVAASANGPTPSHTNGPGEANCTACHGDFPVNSGTGN